MTRIWLVALLVPALALNPACSRDRAADDDRDYDVVVRDDSDEDADTDFETPADDDLKGSQPDQEQPPSLDALPPDQMTRSTQPPDMEPSQEAVGWVSVSATDGVPYEVWQDGRMRGRAALRLTQRPGGGEYVVRDEDGRIMCRGIVDVRQYESVCLECDVRTGRFRRGPC
jgi:hypothetical protein